LQLPDSNAFYHLGFTALATVGKDVKSTLAIECLAPGLTKLQELLVVDRISRHKTRDPHDRFARAFACQER
jgi:hypothetical protein